MTENKQDPKAEIARLEREINAPQARAGTGPQSDSGESSFRDGIIRCTTRERTIHIRARSGDRAADFYTFIPLGSIILKANKCSLHKRYPYKTLSFQHFFPYLSSIEHVPSNFTLLSPSHSLTR